MFDSFVGMNIDLYETLYAKYLEKRRRYECIDEEVA